MVINIKNGLWMLHLAYDYFRTIVWYGHVINIMHSIEDKGLFMNYTRQLLTVFLTLLNWIAKIIHFVFKYISILQ